MNDTAASRVSCRLYPPVFSTVFWSVSPILLCHTQPFWIISCGRCRKCTLTLRTSFSHALATLVTVLVFTSSLRRIRLAAERVDVDTEILRLSSTGGVKSIPPTTEKWLRKRCDENGYNNMSTETKRETNYSMIT